MNTERKPVDVLAVMQDAQGPIAWQADRAIERYEADCKAGYGASLIERSRESKDRAVERCEQLTEARAAVAELIRLTLAIDAECGNAKPDFGKVCALASEAAALARCGVQS